MKDLTTEVKEFCRGKGADLVGIVSAETLNRKAPAGYRPKDLLEKAKVSIVLAIRWVDSLIEGLPETRPLYSRYMLAMMWKCDILTFEVARYLQEQGYSSMPIPNGDPYDLKDLKGCLSHKHAAVEAGLGEFGLNSLLLTPQYGPRQRFGQVLTEAPLQADKPRILNLCKNMIQVCGRACVKVCPMKAIPSPDLGSAVWKKIVTEGQSIDKQRCSYHQDCLPRMGRNGYTFRCGLCISSCPVASPRAEKTKLKAKRLP
jgi:epoxyqueuosine reductase QueG